MTVNYNAARTVLAGTASTDVMAITSVTMLSGRTNPILVASGGVDEPMAPVLNQADQTITIEANVASTSNPAASNDLASSCELSAPAYLMDPSYEKAYLELGSKRLQYDDIYEFTISSKNTGQSFNEIISNGILRPKQLVIVPVLASQTATADFIPYQSPFDTCPGTTSPCASITQFNVLLSGKAVYQQNISYGWSQFLNEVATSGAMGGLEDGVASGLISQHGWENGFSYHVVDLSRRLDSEDRVPISIQITGTNNTLLSMTYLCFVTYERSLSIDIATGSVTL